MKFSLAALAALLATSPALAGDFATKVFSYDFADFSVGTAEYANGPTGCTVFKFANSPIAAVDLRGGATGTRETSSIDPLNSFGAIDALVLAGGSTYGLDAAGGVMDEILRERGGKVDFNNIPSVPAAVIYDFSGRTNAVFPDKALGAQAYRNARKNQLLIGQAGAGINATVGKYLGRDYAEKSGQGASIITVGKIKIFGVTVVNAMGNVLNRNGQIIAGSLDPKTRTRVSIADTLLRNLTQPGGTGLSADAKGNTTISILITNAKVSRTDLQRLTVMAHTAMGRVIEPFQTPWDGDTLFAVSTGTEELPKNIELIDVGTLAGRVMQDAVNAAVTR